MTKRYTPTDLRSDVRTAELLVARIRQRAGADDILTLFRLLDDIQEECTSLQAAGIDLRPEQGRLETIYSTLHDRGRAIVRALSARGGLPAQRAQLDPPSDHAWWYLDRWVAQRRAQQTRRWLRGSALGAVLLAVIVVAYVLFIRPDRATRLQYEYINQAQSAFEAGDYAAALEHYRQAIEVAPDDPETCLMAGVVSELLGRAADAETYYARAESLYDTRAQFLAIRSPKYALLGWYERAEEDAREAIALDEQLPLGYLALGNVYEGQGRVPEAIEALEQCAELASAQDQDQLYVIVKVRLSMLLQTPTMPTFEPDQDAPG